MKTFCLMASALLVLALMALTPDQRPVAELVAWDVSIGSLADLVPPGILASSPAAIAGMEVASIDNQSNRTLGLSVELWTAEDGKTPFDLGTGDGFASRQARYKPLLS